MLIEKIMMSIGDIRESVRAFKNSSNNEKSLKYGFFAMILAGFGYSSYHELVHGSGLFHLDAVVVLGILVYFASLVFHKYR